METQNAHEHVLIVGQICHLFDIIDMRMLAKVMYRLSWNLFSNYAYVNRYILVYPGISMEHTIIYQYILQYTRY
jgi:hypothetical protein